MNNKAFGNVSIILFLNKTDLLEQKIREVSIADYFPQFQGNPAELTDVQNFELGMFDSRRRIRDKTTISSFHHGYRYGKHSVCVPGSKRHDITG